MVKMAYLISNRKLVRVLCVLITSLCGWMMYLFYQTHLTDSRSYFSHVQEFDSIDLKFAQSYKKFMVVGSESTYLTENMTLYVVKATSPKSNGSEYIGGHGSDKHISSLADSKLDVQIGERGEGTQVHKSSNYFHRPNNSYLHHGVVDKQRNNEHLIQKPKDQSAIYVTSGLSEVKIIKQSKQARSQPVKLKLLPQPADRVSLENKNNSGYLVYLCDSSLLCGGWGDRQRGLTSLYFISRVVGRQFKIVMTTPCDLSYFYLPNRIDWRVDNKELGNLTSTKINSMHNDTFISEIMSGDFNQNFPYQVVYIRTNSDLYDKIRKNSIYTRMIKQWTGVADKRDRFRWAWHDLMSPSQMLLKHLEHIVGTSFLIRKGLITEPVDKKSKKKSIYDLSNSTLVCGHVRIGKNPTIPMDEDLSNFKITDLPTLHGFMLAKGRAVANPYYFVAADYDYVREKSRVFFGDRLVYYGGKIIHIDRQRTGQRACVGLEVALIDQLLLSLCDVLVICKSGFSRHASYLNNSTENIYILENGQIQKHNFIQIS